MRSREGLALASGRRVRREVGQPEIYHEVGVSIIELL